MSVADVIRNAEKAVDRYDALKENSGMTYEDGYDWAERFHDHIIDLVALAKSLAPPADGGGGE